MLINIPELFLGFMLGTLSNVLVRWGWRFSESPWGIQRPNWARRHLKPGIRGAGHLRRLQNLLGDIVVWLGTDETSLMKEVAASLWKQVGYLKIEELAYHAIFANNTDQQLWAVGQLSKMKAQAQANAVLTAIRDHPVTPETVRIVAQQALDDQL